MAAEEEAKLRSDECDKDDDTAVAAAAEGDLPEMLDLISQAEEAASDPAELAAVLRNIGKRAKMSQGDRDLLSDWEAISQICTALAGEPHSWKGEAMLAFCRAMPDVCRTSTPNRGSLRDEGFVAAAVEYLRGALESSDEAATSAASTAICATSTSNDGNKKDASAARPLLLEALDKFPESMTVQTEAIAALRALVTDDDPRKSETEPSAVENRELIMHSEKSRPLIRSSIKRALDLVDSSEKPQTKLREQTLLLLREIARGEDRIKELAFDDKLLARAQAAVEDEKADPRVVRAGLSCLRAFAWFEEAREEIALLTDGAEKSVLAVKRHMATPTVCEQGFGLFANLTMRKAPMIVAKLYDDDILGVAQFAIRTHKERPDVARVAIHTVRNVANQEETAVTKAEESDLIEELRNLVKERDGASKWASAVDMARQFLREVKADEGVRKAAMYNEFY
eukprot:TRINITY_DN41899_c0_g1_i1.p1 TRINITY_DN41899_c0_g1~~TRINITY_DN41899_c0_g1_i1.p1  ORF type:complete len:455 (-),score=125.13 TRINITY_DN41899_c0_g1_i1:51-1415(-)